MMKKIFILLVLSGLFLSSFSAAQEKGVADSVTPYRNQDISIDFERQWAFIIAIDKYAYLKPLKYPVKEAKQVEELLENRYGYSPSRVKILLDDKATYNAVIEQLKWYVTNLVEKDNLFIYFSGHGYKDDLFKKGFWMPWDAGSDKQATSKEKATETLVKISNHDIVDVLRECKAKHIFVVADSCFSGQFFAAQPKVDRVPGTHYNLKSRQLLASGREMVGDGDFGKYFISYLNANQETYLMASDLITSVRTMVINNTDLEPEGKPVKNTGDEGGEFILGRRLASLKQLEYKPNRPTAPPDIDTSGLKAEAERNRWLKWQKDFQKKVENRQKSDEDRSVTAASKRKSWESILSMYNKDNPETGEDEKLRKFVIGRIEYWRAKEKEELEWSNWQRKFKENVGKLEQFDKEPDISAASKKQKWQELLKAYSMDNPYSDEDEQLRKYATERIKNYERETRGEPIPGFDDESDSIPGFAESNPFGKIINYKAKNIYKNHKGFWEADYGHGIVMVYIPAGEFTMGSNNEGYDENPPHNVYLDGYWMGKYEVTYDQYDRYCDEIQKRKPSNERGGRGKLPVMNISWDDASAYCDWLSIKTGLRFKLPTEAQWEKAARGTEGRKYPWGNHDPFYNGKYYANYNPDKNEADGFRYTAPVGSYPDGESLYGLLDMAGNVCEWCSDRYDDKYYKNSPRNNPTGPISGSYLVMRGGGWSDGAGFIRCASRAFSGPSNRNSALGFRLCQENQ